MQAAARASGIDVQIPKQPGWPKQLVEAFEQYGPVDAHGAAMAWLGHIDLLKFVFQSGWSSALILEDDMDWDLDIRNQTQLISGAVLAFTDGKDTGQKPYGLGWDVIWMGHCSDLASSEKPILIFKDTSVGALRDYRGLNRHITTVLKEGERCVHYSENAVCSFGYAVSADGAQKLLRIASLGHGGAFDLMLMSACRDQSLTCVSVNPEVFDPYRPAGGESSEVRAGDRGETVEIDMGSGKGTTDNIRQSARCFGLFESVCNSG